MGNAVVIPLHGILMATDMERLNRLFDQLLGEGISRFVMDARSLQLLQSPVIGAILRLTKTAKERGGGVYLVKPTDRVRLILDTTRVTNLVPISETVEEAVKELGETSSSSP